MNIEPGLLRIHVWTRKFQKQHLNSVSQIPLPVLLIIISNRFFFFHLCRLACLFFPMCCHSLGLERGHEVDCLIPVTSERFFNPPTFYHYLWSRGGLECQGNTRLTWFLNNTFCFVFKHTTRLRFDRCMFPPVIDKGSCLPVIHIGVVAFLHLVAISWGHLRGAYWNITQQFTFFEGWVVKSQSLFSHINTTSSYMCYTSALHMWCESFVFYKDSW